MNLPKTGVPYAFPSDPPRTFDCWSLMVYLRAELGLWTPPVAAEWVPETMASAIAHEKQRWVAVTRPEKGDVALMNLEHLGVFLGPVVAHSTPATGVLYTPALAVRRRFPDLRYFRPCQ